MVSVTLILHESVINRSAMIKTEITLFFFPNSLHFKDYTEISECSVKDIGNNNCMCTVTNIQ